MGFDLDLQKDTVPDGQAGNGLYALETAVLSGGGKAGEPAELTVEPIAVKGKRGSRKVAQGSEIQEGPRAKSREQY